MAHGIVQIINNWFKTKHTFIFILFAIYELIFWTFLKGQKRNKIYVVVISQPLLKRTLWRTKNSHYSLLRQFRIYRAMVHRPDLWHDIISTFDLPFLTVLPHQQFSISSNIQLELLLIQFKNLSTCARHLCVSLSVRF